MRYLLLLLIFCAGCITTKPQVVYFNDSEKIESAKAGESFCKDLGYDCVRMSKGQFRNLTTINN